METDSWTPRQLVELFVEQCHCQSESSSFCPLSRLRDGIDEEERRKQIADLSDEEVESLHQHIMLCISGRCGTEQIA
jgi:hypothetical protein